MDLPDTIHAYYDALKSLWESTTDRDLIIVEHDIVVSPQCITILSGCTKGDYCSWDYPIGSGNTNGAGLGCVKFSKELISGVPGLFDEILAINWPHSGDTRHWSRLDGRIHHILQRQHRSTIHIHQPPLWHRNPSSSTNYADPPAGYDELIRSVEGNL